MKCYEALNIKMYYAMQNVIFFYGACFEYLNWSHPIINVYFPNVQDFNRKERNGQTGASGDSLGGRHSDPPQHSEQTKLLHKHEDCRSH